MPGPYSKPFESYPSLILVLDMRKRNPKELSNAQEHTDGKHQIQD